MTPAEIAVREQIAQIVARVDRDLVRKYERSRLLVSWDRAVAAYRHLCATPWGTRGHFPAMAAYDAAINDLPASLATPYEAAKGGVR